MLKMRGNWAVLLGTAALVVGTGVAVGQPKSTRPTLTSPTPTAPTIAPLSPSAIGTPGPQLRSLAPLAPPPIVTTTPSSGGTARPDALASPTPLSSSPSELAASVAGGGGHTVQDCVGFWDKGTHMTKSEWRLACERSLHRLDNLKVDNLAGFAKQPGNQAAYSSGPCAGRF